ncbi:MAG TPA: hypothetical protein PKA00_04020 [Saprospiraceae bacterium]|nr:hypothetical protein [Saprospiraceae bacterium]HMQ82045.1 hypothetical protein [Saprospiraceae bacterium]
MASRLVFYRFLVFYPADPAKNAGEDGLGFPARLRRVVCLPPSDPGGRLKIGARRRPLHAMGSQPDTPLAERVDVVRESKLTRTSNSSLATH